jgi:dihydrodipicolinate synthase/N-acetylneuraminate lyase
VVGMKMEGGNTYYARQLVPMIKDRLAVIGDWGEEYFLFGYEYGVTADISGLAQFAPRLCVDQWHYLRDGNLAGARKLTNDVLVKYYAAVVEMDWVAAMKASMEFVGLPASPMRPPNAQLTPAERERIRRAMRETGLLPR